MKRLALADNNLRQAIKETILDIFTGVDGMIEGIDNKICTICKEPAESYIQRYSDSGARKHIRNYLCDYHYDRYGKIYLKFVRDEGDKL